MPRCWGLGVYDSAIQAMVQPWVRSSYQQEKPEQRYRAVYGDQTNNSAQNKFESCILGIS